jgi:hypothetical protein
MSLYMWNRFAMRGVSRPSSPRLWLKELLLATFVLGGLFAAPASALNSIALDPTELTVTEGDTFTIQMVMNFDDPTIGGGLEVTYDPLVSFISFDFDAGLGDTPPFRMPATDNDTTQPLELGFGFFPTPASGQRVVGTFTFRAEGVGTAQFVTLAPSGLIPGPFYGPLDPMNPMDVTFGSSAVTIVAAQNVVPEPSATLLMFVGLVGLSLYPAAPAKGRSR